MAQSLDLVMVSSSTAGFLVGFATRDSPFAFGVYYAFWLIFAFTYYVNVPETPQDIFFYVPIIVALTTVTGATLAKMLNIGQLVDVWMTGSGGGANNVATSYEELNLPLMPLTILFAFFSVFFGVAAASCSTTNCADFLGGIWAVSSSTVGWLLFGVFVALTLLAFFASAIQTKYGNRHKKTHDYASLLYTFIVLFVATVPMLMWHLPTTWSVVTRGWVAAAVALVADGVFFAIGSYYENSLDYDDDDNKITTRNGRFYSVESSSTVMFFRFFFLR